MWRWADSPLWCGWALPNQLKDFKKRKRQRPPNVEGILPPECSTDILPESPAFGVTKATSAPARLPWRSQTQQSHNLVSQYDCHPAIDVSIHLSNRLLITFLSSLSYLHFHLSPIYYLYLSIIYHLCLSISPHYHLCIYVHLFICVASFCHDQSSIIYLTMSYL